MAYEKNQYSYFQNINLDSDGALIVNTNGGARTTMSNPIVLSAITITTDSYYTFDIDGTNGNTFYVDYTLEYDPLIINKNIETQLNSLSNFNDGDILYLIYNFNNADLETRQFNLYFYNYPTINPWFFTVNANTNPKCILFSGQVWNNQFLIPYIPSDGSIR